MLVKRQQKPEPKTARLFPSFPVVIASMEHNGERNLITLGLVHVFSFNPFVLGIGISPERHSYSLIDKSGEFVVNIPTRPLHNQIMICGTKSGRDTDKFAATGFTAVKGTAVNAPIIKECPVNFECRVIKKIEVGDHAWFMGTVLNVHIDSDYRREDAVEYWAGQFNLMGETIGKKL